MTAPPPVPGAFLDRLEEARQAVAEALWRDDTGSDVPLSTRGRGTQRTYTRVASTVLAVPEVAELLRLAREGQALRDRVLSVEAILAAGSNPRSTVEAIRRALVADTTGEGQ